MKSQSNLSVPTFHADEAIRRYHEQSARRALKAISALRSKKNRDAFDKRDISAVVIPVNPERLAEAKLCLGRFRRKMIRLLSQGPRTSLYQLNLHLFDVLEPEPAPKKTKRALSLAALLLCLSLSVACTRPHGPGPTGSPLPPPLKGGTEVGSATDNPAPGDDVAWFLGERKIRYCFVLSPKFNESPIGITSVLQEAWARWADYIWDRQINWERPLHAQLAFPEEAPMEECDGTEDVKFYFGIENDEVNAARSRLRNPTAFAQPTGERGSSWRKGFIWIANDYSIDPENWFPDWRAPKALLSALLHEIGHVYGNDHIPGTIMSADYNDIIHRGWAPILGQIDMGRELATCLVCEEEYGTRLPFQSDEDYLLITWLMGRPRVNDWEEPALFVHRANRELWDSLTIFDGNSWDSPGEFPITGIQVFRQASGLKAFRTEVNGTKWYIPDASFVQNGWIRSKDSTYLLVTIKSGMRESYDFQGSGTDLYVYDARSPEKCDHANLQRPERIKRSDFKRFGIPLPDPVFETDRYPLMAPPDPELKPLDRRMLGRGMG